MKKVVMLTALAGWAVVAGATRVLAQPGAPGLAQVVALDECDPDSFNMVLGREGLAFATMSR